MLKVNVIVAVNKNGIIGTLDGKMPWDVPEDLVWFKKVTTSNKYLNKKNALIMGYNTHISIGRTLPDRFNLVLSSKQWGFIDSWEKMIKSCDQNNDINKIFVIGGAQIYQQIFNMINYEIYINKIYISFIDDDLNEGIRFPFDIQTLIKNPKYKTIFQERIQKVEFIVLKNLYPPFEYQYQKLVNDISLNGEIKESRNAKTLSLNDRVIKIDLNDGFPISTIKKTFWRGIVEELMWMLRGETDTKILNEKNIHIWDGNSSREYLDKYGFEDYPVGEIGPSYGYQFRKIPGNDQLIKCINLLKSDPNSRRNIINLWNVQDIDKMALPPCHLMYQFSVSKGKLCCHLYQRSWDILLGWNTTTAALLTHLIAHQLDMNVGTLTHTICDVHIYQDHIKSLEYMKNVPYKLPTLKINKKLDDITSYEFKDFELKGYIFHPTVKLQMFS